MKVRKVKKELKRKVSHIIRTVPGFKKKKWEVRLAYDHVFDWGSIQLEYGARYVRSLCASSTSGGTTDEGYHYDMWTIYAEKYSGWVNVEIEHHTEGQDCDGRLDTSTVYVFNPKTGRLVSKSSRQRDYSAEAMGY